MRTQGIYRWYALGVLFLAYTINLTHRQLLAILAEDVKNSMGLSDAQLGFLYGTSFAILYALFGLVFARLADRVNRVRLLAFGVALWSSATALCGLAGSFLQLAAARMGVGVGQSAASPAAYSLISDMFEPERRGLALAIYNSGAFFGISIALPLGGFVLANWNLESAPLFALQGWQATFLILALPGLAIAIWLLTLREPRASGGTPGNSGLIRDFLVETCRILPPFSMAAAAARGELARNLGLGAVVTLAALAAGVLTGDHVQWVMLGLAAYSIGSWSQALRSADEDTHRQVTGSSTLRALLVVAFCISALSNALLFWMAPFAIRMFDVSVGTVGTSIGIPAALACVVGSLIGGALSDAAKRRDARGRLWVIALSVVLTPVFVVAAFFSTDFDSYVPLILVALFVMTLHFASLGAAFQELVPAAMRATAAGTMFIATSLGIALGPYISGKVSTLTGSLQAGVLATVALMPIALFVLWLAFRSISSSSSADISGPKPPQLG